MVAAGQVAASTLLSVGLLTALDRRLDEPAVLRFDLGWQAAVHAHTSPRMTAAMLALTWIGSIKVVCTALAIVLGLQVAFGRRRTAIVLGSAMVGGLILNETLKLHFHRLRPQVPWSIGDEHTFSFPSGHSLFAVVLYGTLAWMALRRPHSQARRWSAIVPATLLPLGIGFSRIYLGMHYPTDVLAGFTVGLLWLVAVIQIARVWLGKRPIEETEEEVAA